MSGFIGEIPKRMKRGWMEVLDKTKILWETITTSYEEVENVGVYRGRIELRFYYTYTISNNNSNYRYNLFVMADEETGYINIPYQVTIITDEYDNEKNFKWYIRTEDGYEQISRPENTSINGMVEEREVYYYEAEISTPVSYDVYFKFNDEDNYILLDTIGWTYLGYYETTKYGKFYKRIETKNKSETRTPGAKPVFGRKMMTIKKAWIGNENREPELVLYSENYYMHDRQLLPYPFYRALAVVYNNKIHFLGINGVSGKWHYSWDGETWVNESILPYEVSRASTVVVYNNKIHVLGGAVGVSVSYDRCHYSWNGTSWTQESTLPYSFNRGCAAVYDGKIHIVSTLSTTKDGDIYDYNKHYSWDGTSWVAETPIDLLTTFENGMAVVYNNKLHLLGGNSGSAHHSWDGVRWNVETNCPQEFTTYTYPISAVVYDGKIHMLGGYNSNDSTAYYENTKHCSWDGTQWIEEDDVPYSYGYGYSVVYDNKIYVLGGDSNYIYTRKNHYTYDKKHGWIQKDSLPYTFYRGFAVVFNDKIHILGGQNDDFAYFSSNAMGVHFSFDSNGWKPAKRGFNLPYYIRNGCVVVYDNMIHLLIKSENDSKNCHYKWDGVSKDAFNNYWIKVSDLSFYCYESSAVVYNGRIHVLGGNGHLYMHKSWDGTSWVDETNTNYGHIDEYDYGFRLAAAVVYHDKIYVIGGLSYNDVGYPVVREIYYDDYYGRYVTNISSLPGEAHFVGGSAVVYHDRIHIFGNSLNDGLGRYNLHYSAALNSLGQLVWKKEWDIPYSFYNGAALVCDDEMHLLGGQSSKLMKLDTNENRYFK